MVRSTWFLILTLVSIWSGFASAANYTDDFKPHPFFGMGYTYSYYNTEFKSDSGTLLGAIIGYRFHPNLALDFRGYSNVSNDEGNQVTVNRDFSLLIRPIVPLNENVEFYGFFGYAGLNTTTGGGSAHREDVQYGSGISINKGAQLELQIELINLYDEHSLLIHGLNVNVVYNF